MYLCIYAYTWKQTKQLQSPEAQRPTAETRLRPGGTLAVLELFSLSLYIYIYIQVATVQLLCGNLKLSFHQLHFQTRH